MIIGPCTVVTGGPEPAVLEDAGVRVIGSHIAQVGPAGSLAAAHPDDTLWPARGRVLMPGLVNTHAHLARSLARGLPLRTPAEWRRFDRAMSPEDVHWATAAALVEGVRHGVTTVCDFNRAGAGLDRALPEVIEAATRVGVRLAACFGADESDPVAERRAVMAEGADFAHALARAGSSEAAAHRLTQLRERAAAEHRGGFEQLGVHRAHAEDGIQQDRIERAEEHQEYRGARAQAEEDHRQRQPCRNRHGAQDRQGRVELVEPAAAEAGAADVVSMLLQAGADPNARDRSKESGLLIAARVLPEAREWGIEEAEFSWVLESNKLSYGTLKRGGAKITKRYRFYDYPPPPTTEVA